MRIGSVALRDAEAHAALLLAKASLAGGQKVIAGGMNPGARAAGGWQEGLPREAGEKRVLVSARDLSE